MTDDRRRHIDWTGRETTRPGPHVPRADASMSAASAIEMMDPLAETIDEARSHSPTPVEGIAIRLRAAIDEHTVPPGWASEVIDAIVVEVAQRTAEQRARELAAGDSMPRRVRELEAGAASLATWRRQLTGEADRNGRFGKLSEDVADIRAAVGTDEERRAEKATVARVRWSGAKLLVVVGFAATVAGGGIWTTIKSRDAIARAEGRREQHEIEQDRRLDRCDPPHPRSTTP